MEDHSGLYHASPAQAAYLASQASRPPSVNPALLAATRNIPECHPAVMPGLEEFPGSCANAPDLAEEDVRAVPLDQILVDLKREGIDPQPLIHKTRERIAEAIAKQGQSAPPGSMLFCLARGKAEWLKMPIVADGCVFADGRAVLAWRGEHASVAIYPTLRDLYEVHRRGHEDTAIITPDREAELSLDPWHPESFVGTPVEGVFQDAAPRRLVWLKIDWCGNAVGVIGFAESFDGETP